MSIVDIIFHGDFDEKVFFDCTAWLTEGAVDQQELREKVKITIEQLKSSRGNTIKYDVVGKNIKHKDTTLRVILFTE